MKPTPGIFSGIGTLLCSLLATTVLATTPQTISDRLTPADSILPTDGTFFKMHEFTVHAGDLLKVDLISDAFDAFLFVHSPSAKVFRDDDSGDGFNSRIVVPDAEGGVWRAFANVVGVDNTGPYTIEIQRMPADMFTKEVRQGALAEGNPKHIERGGYYQEHTFEARAGQELVINLDAEPFDAFLIVHAPSGQVFTDDDGGEDTNAALWLTADEGGTWRVFATSFDADQTGPYQLTIRQSR